jgi:hypothetical protein
MPNKIDVILGDMILPVNPKSVSTDGENKIIQIEVPGRDGDIIQHMGGKSRTMSFSGTLFDRQIGGVWYYIEDFQASIIDAWRTKTPQELTFPLQVAQNKYATKVTVKKIHFGDVDGRYRMVDYNIDLVEFNDVNVGKVSVDANLVNFGPTQNFIKKLVESRVLPNSFMPKP